jgi:hypothetical protein
MKSRIEDGGLRIAIFYPPYPILNGKKLLLSSLFPSPSAAPVDCSQARQIYVEGRADSNQKVQGPQMDPWYSNDRSLVDSQEHLWL